MFGLLAGGLGALGGMAESLGGLLSPIFGAASASATNRTMRQIAAKNREWMEKMSNTAHQREVDDLRAAGLNPILSAGSLSGASTPSVSTDYSQQSYTPDFSGFGKGLRNTASAVDFYKTLQNKDANTELQQAQAQQANSATALNQAKTNAQLLENSNLPAFWKQRLATMASQDLLNRSNAALSSESVSNVFQLHRKNLRENDFWESPLGRRIFSAQQENKAYGDGIFNKQFYSPFRRFTDSYYGFWD